MKMNRFESLLMTFDIGRQVYLKGIVKDLRTLSQLPSGKKILEIGCGNGVGTQLIEEIFQPVELTATEYDQELADIARTKNKKPNVLVEVGDATRLRFKNNEFDAVIGLSVLHHIPNWEDSVNELRRVLKPGGLLILKELSIETFETFPGQIARRFVAHPYDDMLKKDEFLYYIERYGFKTKTCRPHSMLHFLNDFFLVAQKV